MGVFDNIPSNDLNGFMKNFSYDGLKRDDLDRTGVYGNRFSSDQIGASEDLQKARTSSSLARDRLNSYGSQRKHGPNWLERYQEENLKKSYQGRYTENYERYQKYSRASEIYSPVDIHKYKSHRPDNIHYNATPLSRNQIDSRSERSNSHSGEELGRLISDFDSSVDRTKPSDIFQKVDQALELADKVEGSNPYDADYVDNLEALIAVFDLMDSMISSDISRLQGIRNGDKGNRGQDTGKQTSKELQAVDTMMSRTNQKAQLNTRRQQLNQELVLKSTFRR